MKRYKLYVEGLSYIDSEGNIESYTIINHRNAKKAARDYGRDVTITNMSDKVVSMARLDEMGKPYSLCVHPGGIIW